MGLIIALFFFLIYFVMVAAIVAGLWKIFVKAGQPGWAAIVPFYNLYVLIQVCGKPAWWFILLLIPFINVVIMILLLVQLANCFGKDGIFVVGLVLLPFIFYPMLGFGDAVYTPPVPSPV